MAHLTVTEERTGDVLRVTLIGDLNDPAALAQLELEGIREVQIDFDNLGTVNSAGLAAWIFWARSIEAQKPQSVVLLSIPARFMRIVFAVKDIIPSAWKIRSLTASYFCSTCNQTTDRPFENAQAVLAAHLTDPGAFAHHICWSCKNPVELDDSVERYIDIIRKYA